MRLMFEPIPDDEISKERLEELFRSAFFKPERDADDDLVVRDDGVVTVVKVEEDRKLITFFSLWPMRTTFSEEHKLQWINRLNDRKILVRFCMPKPTLLWVDYQFLYEGGVSPYFIITAYKRYVSICRELSKEDEDEIIGRE